MFLHAIFVHSADVQPGLLLTLAICCHCISMLFLELLSHDACSRSLLCSTSQDADMPTVLLQTWAMWLSGTHVRDPSTEPTGHQANSQNCPPTLH